MNPHRLLVHLERLAETSDAVPRTRRFILDLAVRGKLVPQDPNDEPASELLQRIAAEKARLVKAGGSKLERTGKEPATPVARFASPKGWVWTHLQAVCTSITDGDHLPPPKAETGVPFLVISDVRAKAINYSSERYVPRDYYEGLDAIRRPKPGDLLYTLVGSFGIPVEVRDDKEFCVQRHIGILRPSQNIPVSFLARIMESEFVFQQVDACATGIAQKTVPLSGLRILTIPLPPLAEQHRIVAKVDELMALCDRLEAARNERESRRDLLVAASLHRLSQPEEADDTDAFRTNARFYFNHLARLTTRPEHVKQLRQTILNVAVRGKLVEQDPNDEPAMALLERIAAEKARLVEAREINRPKRVPAIEQAEPSFGAPRGWVWSRLLEISCKIHYGFTTSANRAIDDVRMLRITDIQDNKVDWRSVPGCQIEKKTLPQFRLKEGDILIARTGGTIGKSFLVEDLPVVAVFASYLIRVQGSREIDNKYLKLFLESPIYWAQLQEGARGAGQPNVNGQTLGNMLVPLPPLAEQHRIVAKVGELMALCDRLEASLAETEADSRRLLEAVLHEALLPSEDALEAAD